MSADLEQDLRELFAADATRAPVAHDLAEGARSRARARGRRERRVAVLASATVAAAAIGGFALVRPAMDHSGPTASRPPVPTATATAPSDDAVAPEEPALQFHNVEVPVPAAMLDPTHVECGQAVADAAYVIPRPPSCFIDRTGSPRLTTVVLQPWTDQIDHNVGGKLSPGVLRDGRTRLVTRIPASDLQLIVTSPDPKRAARLFNGLKIIEMAHGCPVQDLGPSADTRPWNSAAAVGGSVCAYQGGWLVGSSWLDADAARSVAGLAALPRESSAPCPSPSGTRAVDNWVVHLRLPDGERVIRADFDACNPTPLTERLGELAPPPTDTKRS
jgi:hypothetical protein